MAEELKIPKRSHLKGDDGHKTFSIRVKNETFEELERLVTETALSRNAIINIMLEFGIKNCVIEDK